MYVNKMQAEAEKADAQLYELCVSLQSTIEGAEELYTNKNLRLSALILAVVICLACPVLTLSSSSSSGHVANA